MRLPAILIFLIICVSCGMEELPEAGFPALMEVPAHFPPVPQPADNIFTPERWALGRKLFYDPVLSADSSRSCASCHRQEKAFADEAALSTGINGLLTSLNVPTLSNVAYQPYYTSAGGVATLEMQILVPVQEHNELGFHIPGIVSRLKAIPAYVEWSGKAYGREPDAFVVTRALACFERSLISGQSAYDTYLRTGDKAALSENARRGLDLFMSEKCACNHCHSGVLVSNFAFENNGLYEKYPTEGRYRLTELPSDLGKFKVPSLRNIALTPPYMHDGSMQDLETVIRHYESGGKAHVNKSPLIKGFTLTEKERKDLISFLQSLTDTKFIDNPIFHP